MESDGTAWLIELPPDVIDLDDLLLRRWTLDDTEALTRVVNFSHEHLRRWMPWATGAITVEGEREFLVRADQLWREGSAFWYGGFEPGTRIIGAVGLHTTIGPGALEVGYWVAADRVRYGYGTRMAKAATSIAFALPGVGQVEIHCDEANVASAAIPQRLGFRLDRTETDQIEAPAEVGRSMIWVMERGDWPSVT